MAITGIGTKLERSTDGSMYAVMGNVTNISGPGLTRDTIDTTTLDTTTGYRDFIVGLRDAGTLGVTINYDKTGYETLLEDFNSDDRLYWKITLPDNSTFEFEGYVTELPMNIPVDDKISYDLSIKIAGKPIFTAAT